MIGKREGEGLELCSVKKRREEGPNEDDNKGFEEELDYNNPPEQLWDWFGEEGRSDLEHEVERAKSHPLFQSYLESIKDDVDGDYVFGTEDGDPLAELEDFLDYVKMQAHKSEGTRDKQDEKTEEKKEEKAEEKREEDKEEKKNDNEAKAEESQEVHQAGDLPAGQLRLTDMECCVFYKPFGEDARPPIKYRKPRKWLQLKLEDLPTVHVSKPGWAACDQKVKQTREEKETSPKADKETKGHPTKLDCFMIPAPN